MPETKIKAALIQLHAGIKNSDGAAISSALGELEALLAAHGDTLHPQLAHFLAGRSYAKALAYLGGADELAGKPASPPGGCGKSGA
jgi:predicted component of type VI protein secretion system